MSYQELLASDSDHRVWSDEYNASSWEQQQNDLQHQQENDLEINDNMSFDDAVPSESKYLKKEDVGDAGMILTISGFTRETLGSGSDQEEKTILHFREDMKPMVLNRTNAQLIPVITGAKTTGEAKGQSIVVYNDPTISFGDKITGGLRIKSTQIAQPAQAPKAPEFDDSKVPF